MAKHPGGRPRRNTPEQVDAAVNEMIAAYEETGDIQMLDDTELMRRLNVSPGTLERYYQGRFDKDPDGDNSIDNNNNTNMPGEISTKSSYAEALKKLIAHRRRICVAHITADRFNTGWIFLSKQPHWGGFQDVQRTETKQSGTFTVCITDSSGKPLKE